MKKEQIDVDTTQIRNQIRLFLEVSALNIFGMP
jgi:hypothetical protein